MIKLPVILNLRNMTHFQDHLYRGINWMKDAKHKPMIWKSQIQIRSYQKRLQNWHMALQNYKVSFGKIIHAFSHLKVVHLDLLILNYNWKITNVLTSSSWLCTNLKDSAKILMEFWGFLPIKIWARKNFIIYGQWRIMASLIMPWLVSVSLLRKWEKLLMPYLVVITLLKLLEVLKALKHSKISRIG